MRVIVWLMVLALARSAAISCNPGFKSAESGSFCVDIDNRDVLGAIHWLSSPPTAPTSCRNTTRIQGIDICEDFLPPALGDCNVVSFIATTWCDHYGSLEFERYWASRGCNVTLYHYHVFFKGKPSARRRCSSDMQVIAGNVCNNDEELKKINGLTVIKGDMWGQKCYNCLYNAIALPRTGLIDIFKIQEREGNRIIL